MEKRYQLLAVDDDIDFLRALKRLLVKFDFEVELGGRIGTLTNTLTTENSSEVFMFAGFSKQF